MACAAAAVLLYRMGDSGFEWGVLFSTLASIDPVWLAASIFFILLSYVGRALRWRVMIRCVCPNPNIGRLLSSTVIGFTAVVFFGRPGELVRPYLIARKEQVSVASQVAAWVVERIYDLLVVLLLFGFALTRVGQRETIGPKLDVVLRTGGYVAAILAVACVAALFVSVSFEKPARRWFGALASRLPARMGKPLAVMFESFLSGMCWAGSPRVVLELILFSLVEWAIIVASIYCLFQSYPATTNLTLVDNLVFTGFVAFGAAVQLPGIGGGMQVAAVVALTELFGLGIATATGFAVFLWAVTWLLVVPFGVVLAFRDGLRWSSLRHVNEQMARAS